jgi:cob(I)alamin adenosyltransferase
MGNRLSKIYTRTGDKGTTGLGDGSRVSKDHPRVVAFGAVDELNSCLGIVLAYDIPESVRDCLSRIQHDLFDLGGELCIPGHTLIQHTAVERLEQQLDEYNKDLPALKDFILPAGGVACAHCHLARTVCRRAEREVVRLMHAEAVNETVLAYLNRLSDLLFVIARVLARHENGQEVLWQHDRSAPKD